MRFMGFIGFVRIVGCIWFAGFIGFIGFVGFIGFAGFRVNRVRLFCRVDRVGQALMFIHIGPSSLSKQSAITSPQNPSKPKPETLRSVSSHGGRCLRAGLCLQRATACRGTIGRLKSLQQPLNPKP